MPSSTHSIPATESSGSSAGMQGSVVVVTGGSETVVEDDVVTVVLAAVRPVVLEVEVLDVEVVEVDVGGAGVAPRSRERPSRAIPLTASNSPPMTIPSSGCTR